MDGWGGEDANLSASGCRTGNVGNCFYAFTSAQAAAFFSPTSGIGLNIIRTGNLGCPLTGACAINSTTIPNIGNLQLAYANGAQVHVTIAPPANLKYSGNFSTSTIGADGGCVDTSNFSAYATYIVEYIEFVQGSPNNVPVAVVSPFNEANLTAGQCYWTASLEDTFIKSYLGPAISTAGLTTKIMISDDSQSNELTSGTCLADSVCAAYVGSVSFHGYGKGSQDGMGTGYCCLTAPSPPANTTGKHIWQSEVNGGFNYNSAAELWSLDPSIADALVWARSIHDYMTITEASAWEYWELADCCATESGGPFNDALTDGSFNNTKRMYAIGQWSKYVRSGWIRIDATAIPSNGVYLTAFKDPSSDNFAIVAINQNSSPVTVNFSLPGFPSVASVTPTVTSASVSLADQTDVIVTAAAFSYSLPSTSVVTFHATPSSSSSKNPAPPTALSLTIN